MQQLFELNCRPATEADIEILTGNNLLLAEETESKSLDRSTVRRGVTRALQLAPEVRYFVAEWRNEVVGQMMVTREWSDWRNGWMIWLQSVYVNREFRKQGVFRKLFETLQTLLVREAETAGIRLYVENENATARRTYAKLGFLAPGYSVLELSLNSSDT